MEHGFEIVATTLFYIGPLPVTNTVFSAWIVTAVLVIVSLIATRSMKIVPRGAQNLFEYVVELLLTVCESTMGRRRGRRFFPVIATAFLFILFSNWMGLLPGYGDTPWLRSSNSDLNITASMALVVFFLVQFYAVKSQGLPRYLKEFVVPNPLHILSELSRPISLAFRLFGNILAGEVVIITITAMVPLLLPTVFFGLEVFVGILQALIFSMLTMVFLAMATMHEGHDSHAGEGSH
ncbi:MAG TPA: F0F1 ATP synthase subunit A [Chloroflexota bacterium]